ncbi:MAG: RnfH family protein [Luteimonas sp.]
MKVEVVIGWPRRHTLAALDMEAGACVGDAIAAAGFNGADDVIGYAIHGQRAQLADALCDGDRVELLRGLQADPKDARRRRAASTKEPL